MQETQVQSLGWEDTPEEDPLQDSCLRIPWTEKPGRLQFIRLQRVGQDACKIGNGPRWQSRKTLLTSFYTFTGIPKLQLFTEQLLLRSESREKIFYNERYKEGTPRQEEGWSCSIDEPIPQAGRPTNGRVIIIVEVLPKKQQVWALHQAPQPGGSYNQKTSHQNLCLWSPESLFSGDSEGCGNRLHSYMVLTDSHTLQDPRQKQ